MGSIQKMHYAMAGLRTCLVIQTQDPSADYLLNCKIGTTPIICNPNLSAVRWETTKLQMLREPLNRLKQADARLKITQGVLEGHALTELANLMSLLALIFILLVEKDNTRYLVIGSEFVMSGRQTKRVGYNIHKVCRKSPYHGDPTMGKQSM
ncbi:uncharacterized protein At1g26090, chloroplastic-like isoform X4 [Euphorbia lathyris]|uniref:uncharacterized protein At1g26090, chloroplastic-like isoform X4 n=1 Tax=Euphorbia lathyris TaxID=212925 RepID=UPI003314281D